MTATNTADLAVRIDASKPYSKNTLIAFIDFTLLEIGLSIKGASIHEKEGKRWVSMPAREYVKDGERSWTPIIEFASKEARYAISDSVVAAYDRHAGGGPTR